MRWDAHVNRVKKDLQLHPYEEIVVSRFYTGIANWQNLKAWLLERWDRKVTFYEDMAFPINGGRGPQIFYRAAHDLLNHFLDNDWSEFDLVVEHMRSIALFYDLSWVH
jgi:hypothetical protein